MVNIFVHDELDQPAAKHAFSVIKDNFPLIMFHHNAVLAAFTATEQK
jgi:hypothetical protein